MLLAISGDAVAAEARSLLLLPLQLPVLAVPWIQREGLEGCTRTRFLCCLCPTAAAGTQPRMREQSRARLGPRKRVSMCHCYYFL